MLRAAPLLDVVDCLLALALPLAHVLAPVLLALALRLRGGALLLSLLHIRRELRQPLGFSCCDLLRCQVSCW